MSVFKRICENSACLLEQWSFDIKTFYLGFTRGVQRIADVDVTTDVYHLIFLIFTIQSNVITIAVYVPQKRLKTESGILINSVYIKFDCFITIK